MHLCVFSPVCYHPGCFTGTEWAHYGFIRSQPSPFLSGMCLLSSVLRITSYKLRDRALCTQSDSGGLKSPQLHWAQAVPCVNKGGGDPYKGRHTARSNCENRQSFSVPPRGSPAGAGLQGLPKQGGEACPLGFLTSRGNGYFGHFANMHRAFSFFTDHLPCPRDGSRC